MKFTAKNVLTGFGTYGLLTGIGYGIYKLILWILNWDIISILEGTVIMLVSVGIALGGLMLFNVTGQFINSKINSRKI